MNTSGLVVLASALVGALVAGALGWGARGLVTDHIQIPAVIEQQGELCAAATEKAAADAVASEQLRQFRIGEGATQRFLEESQVAADDAKARQDVLELEIADYAQQVANAERVCALTELDLELVGLRKAGEPNNSGGR